VEVAGPPAEDEGCRRASVRSQPPRGCEPWVKMRIRLRSPHLSRQKALGAVQQPAFRKRKASLTTQTVTRSEIMRMRVNGRVSRESPLAGDYSLDFRKRVNRRLAKVCSQWLDPQP
jgi:hypothetical protein